MDYKPNKVTPEKALMKLTRLCSVCEKCCKDIRVLLDRWEIESDKQSEIVDYLIKNKYVDDERFAAAYIKDKANFSNWGVTKIKMGLRSKGITQEIINELIEEIDEEEMSEKIVTALERKMKSLKYKDKYDLANKLLRFSFSRGYDMSVTKKYIQRVGINEEED